VAPAKVPPRDLGSPDLVRGDTKVVSTANWFPPLPFLCVGILYHTVAYCVKMIDGKHCKRVSQAFGNSVVVVQSLFFFFFPLLFSRRRSIDTGLLYWAAWRIAVQLTRLVTGPGPVTNVAR